MLGGGEIGGCHVGAIDIITPWPLQPDLALKVDCFFSDIVLTVELDSNDWKGL